MYTYNLSRHNKTLLDKAKELNLPMGKYLIFGSGAMLIRGLKDGHDIDILVLPEIFKEYKKKAEYGKEGWKLKPCNNDFCLSNDDIELWDTWRPGQWDTAKIIQEAEIIDELPFATLETTLKWKKMNGREKDLEHVKIIENFIANGGK